MIDKAEHHELRRDQYQPSRLVPYTGVHALDWREIMSWYPIDGTIFLVKGIVKRGPLNMTDIACSKWQWDIGQQLFSVLSQHHESGIGIGLSQGLDWSEGMSWHSVEGATVIAGDKAQLEPWDRGVDDFPWWHWNPG